ncbi:Glycosyl transferase family 2 [Ruminococcus flavefaciens]|uniref:Glycosyl transferase family 2 n=1 Tax=Ruminococcus flavefaciens TaxID=1265 RepID=A0A1H6KI54_RUMFL|nr:glycosyltransferase [Ruminococcus flavefaciens]SEH75052.1 Glycosyl transferase family 2 [Ruminococcus flavefaciens]
MNKVAILVSTYNGEKYFREQLDSLVKQKDVDHRIIIRDDGSSDSTIDIIKEYQKENDKISFYKGGNLGVIKSFLDLCRYAADTDAEYFAFCDQDDVWDDDKMIAAVKKLTASKKKYGDIPLLYYCNMRVVDENLNYKRLTYTPKRVPVPKTKYSSLSEAMASGNTFVFNRKLLELINHKNPKWCSMHDSWVFLIACFFGKTVFDDKPHILYRQHGNNVSVSKSLNKNFKHYVGRVKELFKKTDEPRYNNAVNFLECFSDKLKGTDLAEVKKVTEYKKSFLKKLRLITDYKIRGTTWVRDLSNRFLILTNNF